MTTQEYSREEKKLHRNTHTKENAKLPTVLTIICLGLRNSSQQLTENAFGADITMAHQSYIPCGNRL